MVLVANIMQKMVEGVIIQHWYSDRDRANWSTREKSVTVPLCSPPQIPLLLTWDEFYEKVKFMSILATVSFTGKCILANLIDYVFF